MNTVAVIGRMLLALVFVLGVMWLLARWARKPLGGKADRVMAVLARQQLSRTSSVTVVRVMDRALVLGVTEQGVQLITETELSAVEDALATETTTSRSRSRARTAERSAADPDSPAGTAVAAGRRPGYRPGRIGALAQDLAPIGQRRPRADGAPMRKLLVTLAIAAGLLGAGLLGAGSAEATVLPVSAAQHQATVLPASTDALSLVVPKLAPVGPSKPAGPTGTVNLDINPKPSTSVSILLLLTLLSVAPSILLLMTSFTKIFVVLGLTRNALGLNGVPPNQVLAGLSLFLSLFIMSPVVKKVNEQGVQPYLHNTKSQAVAFRDGIAPIREFMLAHTRSEEIALMLRAGHLPNPPTPDKLELTTLIPAFVLSELRSAMIIGFVVYIPFLIIDMVVSSSLMSLGMMMLPPVSVSLPFKLLLFVLVDGWGLIINSLVTSYST